jgi:hypothetical protein
MSDRDRLVSSPLYDAQFVLIVITALLQLIQTVVMGVKMRVRCKDCFCSWRPKGSSPGSSDASSNADGSPKRSTDRESPAAAVALPHQQEISLTPRTAAAVVAAVVAATTPRTSVSLSEAVAVVIAAAAEQRDAPAVAPRSRTPSIGDIPIRRARTPSSSVSIESTPKRASVPPIRLEAVLPDQQ